MGQNDPNLMQIARAAGLDKTFPSLFQDPRKVMPKNLKLQYQVNVFGLSSTTDIVNNIINEMSKIL